jgi:hypothetical protein
MRLTSKIYPVLSISTNISTFTATINQNLMKKQYSILSFALSLFFFSAVKISNAQPASKSDVSVSRTVSSAQMAADGRPMVVVTVTIHKFKFTGPGKIEEDFSSDFQAVAISTNRATFQTGGGKAFFTWSNIQEDMTVTVSYALEALNKTENNQTINGKFFYQNQAFPIAASSFIIDASNLPAYKAPPAEDRSPLDEAFAAVTGNYMDGTTPTAAGTPVASMPASSSMASSGSSSQPSTQSSPTTSSSAPMQTTSSSAPVTSSAPMQTTSSSTPATTTPVASSTPDNSSANNSSSSMNNSSSQNNSSTSNSTPVANNSSSNSSSATNNSPSSQPSNSNSSSSSSAPAMVGGASAPGLVYRVQIIVVGDKSKLPGFLRHYNITDQPVYDPADGTPVRVMVGNYANYNAAKARATDLKNKGVAGAFVAPYYNGQRITIADAASHTAQ